MRDLYNKNKKVFDIIISVLIICSLYIVPSLIYTAFFRKISNEMLGSLFANLVYIVILIAIFYKDLIKEIKIFFKNFKDSISKSFKWYFLCIILMVVFNIILTNILGSISDNETNVREYIVNFPLLAFISVAFVAPISEELIYRKNIMKVINNKWIGAVICALLFGLAHVSSYLNESLLNLLYILPYAALGFGFSIMNYESKTVCTSMFYHSLHNSVSFILIFVANSLGVL